MSNTPLKFLAILGMHRSGTSMLAQACARAGLGAGPMGELLSAQEDNPEGFFENRRLVELNEALIRGQGGSWFAPPSSSVFASQFDGTECRALLQHLAEYAGGPFLIKDPRLCITWPVWSAGAAKLVILYVYRSPLAVARSLAKRNRFPLQLGLQLWELYNRSCLDALAAHPYVAVSYDHLTRGDGSLSEALRPLEDLGFELDVEVANEVFNPALRHFGGTSDDDPAAELLSAGQRDLASYCEALCAGGVLANTPSFAHEAHLRASVADLAASLAPLAEVIETGQERDRALALAEERADERDEALRTLATLESDHTALAEAHAAERARHGAAADTLVKLQAEHEALAQAHRALEADQTETLASHKRLVALHDALHEERAALEVQHAELAERYWQLNEERETLQGALRDLESRYAALQEKADYLFFTLSQSYSKLLELEASPLGAVQRAARRAYRLLTLRRGRRSAQEDLLESAQQHFDTYGLSLPERPPSKARHLLQVLQYVAAHPAASARSFSWHRLRRATKMFFGSSSADLDTWVQARFPERDGGASGLGTEALHPELDTLELTFTEYDDPQVSIIVPVFNDYRYTVNCLRSVLEHSGDVRYEVIVADDCSTDLTTTLDERISGVRVVRTEVNSRFLLNCRNAARQARGDYLLFLNNDTAVTPGWLSALLRPFADPRVGITGPKLLFASGKLQEAGGIIWRDASGWNFGRGDDPDKPAYNYRRDVDYVSGACLLLPCSLWDELGGFDERFAPAYYEDADLCFAARAAGYRVVYEPTSVVFHYEGISNGTDLNAGVKQHQVRNQAVFLDKWRAVLEAQHFSNAQEVIHARDRSAARRCVLVIDHYVPHHDKDAGGRSTFMYLKLLLDLGFRVQFMGANFFPHQPYTAELQALGIEVLVGESIARGLDAWLAEHAAYIDEVFIHRPHVAEQFLPALRRMEPRPVLSYFGHDLHFLRTRREAELKNDSTLRREADRWQERELAVMEQVDRVYYFSDREIDVLAPLTDPGKLRCIPLYALPQKEVPAYAPREMRSLLFVGGYNHPPNVDAALWLVQEILPALWAQDPAVRLHLVGSNPPESVLQLRGERVLVHGYLSDEDLASLYRDVAAAVVPLQYGAGVKGKVIEAVAHGVPVVTTTVGAEGIPDADDVLFVADSAQGMADALHTLFANPSLAGERIARYPDWLRRHFSAETAAQVLLEDMAATRASSDRD